MGLVQVNPPLLSQRVIVAHPATAYTDNRGEKKSTIMRPSKQTADDVPYSKNRIVYISLHTANSPQRWYSVGR